MKGWTRPFPRFASVVVAIALVATLSASCTEPPFQPGPIPPPPVSRAVLVISDFTGLVGPLVRNPTQLGERSIAFDFTLTETGGQSGAIIKTIRWTLDGVLSPFYTGEECWGFNYPPYGMVGPGETLHSLKTDWGYYCDPGAIGVPPVHVGIIITFVDDRGVSGTVEATTFVE